MVLMNASKRSRNAGSITGGGGVKSGLDLPPQIGRTTWSNVFRPSTNINRRKMPTIVPPSNEKLYAPVDVNGHNISALLENNTFTYVFKDNSHEKPNYLITIPDGYYTALTFVDTVNNLILNNENHLYWFSIYNSNDKILQSYLQWDENTNKIIFYFTGDSIMSSAGIYILNGDGTSSPPFYDDNIGYIFNANLAKTIFDTTKLMIRNNSNQTIAYNNDAHIYICNNGIANFNNISSSYLIYSATTTPTAETLLPP